MEQHKILKINFSHFPEDENSAQIPGKLFLIDNFDTPLRKVDREEIMTFPVQVTMLIIFFCRQGKINIKINLKEMEVAAGHACIVLPGSLFQFNFVTDNVECAMIAINPDFNNFTNDVKTGMQFVRQLKMAPVYNLEFAEMEEFMYIYKNLKHKLYQTDYKYKEEIARNYLGILRCDAMHKFSSIHDIEPQMPVSSRKEELFMQFISLLQKHYKEERNVSFYADKICVTPKYLSTVIHDVSDRYATDWITDYVILEAKNMLRVEGRSVKEVCNTLNFANQSFFAKYFKQHTNYTPKEYKNMK